MKNTFLLSALAVFTAITVSCSKDAKINSVEKSQEINQENNHFVQQANGKLNRSLFDVNLGTFGGRIVFCAPPATNCFDDVIISAAAIDLDELTDPNNVNDPNFYLNYIQENAEEFASREYVEFLVDAVESGSVFVELGFDEEATDPVFGKKYLIFSSYDSTSPEDALASFPFVIERGSIVL